MKYPKIYNPGNAPYRIHEEVVNTFIHALGIVFGLIAVPVLIYDAVRYNDVNGIIGSCVYGASFLMVFTSSTLYHGCTAERRKCIFKIWDYVSIFFLIAGTYTPLILKYMPNGSGVFLLSSVWCCTIAGSFFKIYFVDRFLKLSVGIYLFIGLLFLIKCQSFFASMPYHIGFWVVGGVILYVLGIIFFLWQRWYYHHAVWHTFVLAASLCHFFAVLSAVRQ